MKFLLIIFILVFNSCMSKEITIHAKPGGKYILSQGVVEYQINIVGNGSEKAPFYIQGDKTVLSGNSYIKMSSTASNIILKDITFRNNKISYKNSTSLLEIGNSKKSTVNNITLENINFVFNDKSFLDKDKETQFHWINVFGNNVIIKGCSFEGKRNRLPIIHINSNFNNIIVENNTFKNVPSRVGEALEAVRIGLADGDSNALIKNNTFENYFGDSETVSIKANGVTVDHNKFINSRSGVSLRSSNNSTITNNIFTTTVSPIRVAGKNHIIKGNTFNTDSGNISVIVMLGGKNYEQVDNLQIESNIYNKEPTLNFIEMPDNNMLPTNIKFSGNSFNGKYIVSKVRVTPNSSAVNISRTVLGEGKLRKDGSKTYSIKL
ncbi:chondroitinase-B domain-containing protein [Chryseobacterium sp. CT-SW4]|uniref:chondroitinase-B domain-containing protein n=1 Tax=Chryseobacterium sp. SW-1 TaxID=3157343 RepID=UPI003B024C4C